MDLTNELTIVIPVRIDCTERKENLDAVLSSLLNTTRATVIILEADSKQRYTCPGPVEKVKYVFIEDNDPIFHRTRYLNKLLRMSETNIVGIWDTDVIIDASQIVDAAKSVKDGATLCYPYDGRFVFLGIEESEQARGDVTSFLGERDRKEVVSGLGRPSVGGAFIVNKKKYLQAGGENERFYGWGPEDAERLKRLEILEEPVSRVEGSLFHLYHPRGINSGFDHSLKDLRCLKELVHVCKMDKQQLTACIKDSHWNNSVSSKHTNRGQGNNSVSTPLVSVVMPVYNCEEYIESAVKSILLQTYGNFEFIIINDGSTDSTVKRVKKFKDKRIIFRDYPWNKGNYQRRNEGISISKGKYICVMDGDDEASPFRLEAQVSFLENNRSVLATGSQFELIGGGISSKPIEYELIKVGLIQNNMFLHPSLLIRKRVLEILGGYNERYYYSSDYDLVCRVAINGEITNMPDVLMKYRLHKSQISSLKNKEQKEYADSIRTNYLRQLGFTLSAMDEILFNQIINSKNGTFQKYKILSLFKEIINQNGVFKFFDHDILSGFLMNIAKLG
ncbi:glycosyltransferase [Proteiniphilum sp. UBA5346]|uniref:glycosyltransferase n=1 Tax=Proteiniphilum sp. UBA5346 TaxID=1947277 RepID=UPI00257A52A8|nr:glycosyltransferase [Proteiniphilum sp. UBA5346]